MVQLLLRNVWNLKNKSHCAASFPPPSPSNCTLNVYFKKLRRKKPPLLQEPILVVGTADMALIFGSYTLAYRDTKRDSAWDKRPDFS